LKNNNQPPVDSSNKPEQASWHQARSQCHGTIAWLNGGSVADALALEILIMLQEQKMFGKETINQQ